MSNRDRLRNPNLFHLRTSSTCGILIIWLSVIWAGGWRATHLKSIPLSVLGVWVPSFVSTEAIQQACKFNIYIHLSFALLQVTQVSLHRPKHPEMSGGFSFGNTRLIFGHVKALTNALAGLDSEEACQERFLGATKILVLSVLQGPKRQDDHCFDILIYWYGGVFFWKWLESCRRRSSHSTHPERMTFIQSCCSTSGDSQH